METWSEYVSKYYGPHTGYYASANGLRAEYRALQQRNKYGTGYTPYPIYTPRYSNTNDSYIRNMGRSMDWGLYKSLTSPVDAWGYPTNLGRREDGNRSRREQFNRLYANGVFDVIDRGNYSASISQLRAFIYEDNQRRFNNLAEKGLPLDFVAKGKSEWVQEIENSRKVKKLYIGSEGGLDMDGNFNPRLVRRAVRSVDLGIA